MGWIRKIFGRRTPRPDAPPWISPRFLAMVAGLGALVVASFIYYYGGGNQGPASGPGDLADTREPNEAFIDCSQEGTIQTPHGLPAPAPTCDLEEALAQFRATYPGAQIVRVTAEYNDVGGFVGYRVLYTEPTVGENQ